MVGLIPVDVDDLSRLQTSIAHAIDGGPALGFGMIDSALSEVADGTAVVIATSGSSGVPKRVMVSGQALRAGAEATAARIGQGRWLLALPPGYVAGLQVLVRSLLSGTEPEAIEGRFSPDAFVEATRSLRQRSPGATDLPELFTSLVPAQLATLLDATSDGAVRAALQAYSAILVGGQSLPMPLRDRADALGVNLVRTYGATETSGGCVYDGIPLDTVAVRAVDGELRIAGPMLADGYLGDDALTARCFSRDGHGIRWYRTGDLGLVDDGVVRVHGRADNVIVSGGINVSLDRVESIVRAVHGLAGAVVVGVPDERWGEASVVVVERGDALRRSEAEQLAAAREAVEASIGAHARPARLILVDELLRVSSGKPDREGIARAVAALG